MGIGRIFGVMMGLLSVIIALALAPRIETANAVIVSANLTNLIAMSTIGEFGAPLAILGLLSMGGVFTIGAWKTSTSLSFNELFQMIGTAIVLILGFSFMAKIIDYTNDLIGNDASGLGDIFYGIIPLFIYLAIVGLSGWQTYKGYKMIKGRNKKKETAATGFA